MTNKLVRREDTDIERVLRPLPELMRGMKLFPAWDRRTNDPSTNQGVHGVELHMQLGGPDGVVQFSIMTGWHWLPNVTRSSTYPLPADLGYHSFVQLNDWETEMESCDVLGQPCFYSGSGLAARDLYEKMLRDGDEIVWKELTEYYARVFNYDI